MINNKIVIKKKKRNSLSKEDILNQNFMYWVSYWRNNMHRFITDYLGLSLFGFQNLIIHSMNNMDSYIFVASRGIAKSTIALLFAIARCILYPGSTIVVVSPNKPQSKRFIEAIFDLMDKSSNLNSEILKVNTSEDNMRIEFYNSSKIIGVPFGDSSRGECFIASLYRNVKVRIGEISGNPEMGIRQRRIILKDYSAATTRE